jgi:hypothetical protein
MGEADGANCCRLRDRWKQVGLAATLPRIPFPDQLEPIPVAQKYWLTQIQVYGNLYP